MEKTYEENRDHKKEHAMPFEVMLRKFNRTVQQNRLLSEIKNRRYNEKDLTRDEKRDVARHKAYIKKIKRGY